MKDTMKSVVAVDLGSIYTGCLIASYKSDPEDAEIDAFTITMPKNNSFKYLQKERTAIRHHVRSLDRYKKARRLLYQIISYVIERELTIKEEEALSSFIKRRGYNRLEAELDFDVLESCSLKYFADHFSELFNENSPLVDQVSRVILNPESSGDFKVSIERAKLYKELYAKIDLKKIKDEVESDFSSDTKKALKLINNVCDEILSASEFGHKHRKEYFKDILHDLKRDSRLNDLKNLISVEKLHKIICNISNLQLRALRWYFDDPAMEVNNEFNAEKFRNVWVRAYQFFHYKIDKSNEKTEKISLEKRRNINNFILQLQKTDNVVEVLANVDPELTIPPYEDMDNRDPVVDRTLLLNPDALDRQFPQWTRFVDLFVSVLPEISSDLDEILATTDRKSLKNAKDQRAKKIKLKKSYILQRIFDLSKSNHSILSNIRLWSQDLKNTKVLEFNDFIKKKFDENDCLGFLNLAKRYYEECYQAKVGLWSLVDDPLLEMSNLHPRKKNKVKKEIIQSILAIDNNFDFNLFEEIWKKPFGNLTLNDLCSEDAKLFKALPKKSLSKGSSVCSICKKIEKVRKDYGNTFNFYYTKVKEQIERDFLLDDFSDKLKNYVDQEADFKDVYLKSRILSSYLVKKLNLNELDNDRYANPYILSQLYNVLETDTGGFASNVLSVIQENQWRMGSFASENCARCSRLVAESVRPFDGALERFLDRLAYEIADKKIKELKRYALKDTEIDLTILIEENKFDSSTSFDLIKKKSNGDDKKNSDGDDKKNLDEDDKKNLDEDDKKKSGRDGKKRKIIEPWKSKYERIKDAAKGICAYTGKYLDPEGRDCEIDHIIPRSDSKKLMGTIFNSEANLIYVSQEGNQIKKDYRYNLGDLKKIYLETIFGTSNISEIKNKIRNTINNLIENNRNFIFDAMSEEERQCVRHALFMQGDPVYYEVIRAISKLNSALVNGTQAFLIKKIAHKIKQGLMRDLIKFNNTIKFHAFQLDCNEVHYIRLRFSQKYRQYEKQEKQSLSSHAIDALCVYAAAFDERSKSQVLLCRDCKYNLSDPYKLASVLEKLSLIRNFSVSNKNIITKDSFLGTNNHNEVLSKSLFKDSIYAEHFIPVLTKGNLVFIGFNWSKKDNRDKYRIEIKNGGDYFIKIVSPFFTKEYKYSENISTYRIDKHKAFEFMHDKAFTASKSEIEILKCLNALYYTTKNKNILELFFDLKKGFLKKDKKELNDKNFTIKINESINKELCIKGEITIPEKNQWKLLGKKLESILINNEFQDNQNKTDSDQEIEKGICEQFDYLKNKLINFVQEKKNLINNEDNSEKTEQQKKVKKGPTDLDIFNNYFKNKLINPNKDVNSHKKVKRKFSLPVLESPSSSIRIRRYDYKSTPLYQLCSINEPAYKGNVIENGDINWNKVVIRDVFVNKNLTVKNKIEKNELTVLNKDLIEKNNVLDLEKYVCIYSLHDISISMKVASKNRPNLKITMPFDTFKSSFKGCLELNKNFESFYDLKSEIKVGDLKQFNENLNKLIEVCDLNIVGPRNLRTKADIEKGSSKNGRGKILILELGKNIVFSYVADGFNKSMKEKFLINLNEGLC